MFDLMCGKKSIQGIDANFRRKERCMIQNGSACLPLVVETSRVTEYTKQAPLLSELEHTSL
jgi:hypothetical protein